MQFYSVQVTNNIYTPTHPLKKEMTHKKNQKQFLHTYTCMHAYTQHTHAHTYAHAHISMDICYLLWSHGKHKLLILQQTWTACVVTYQVGKWLKLPAADVVVTAHCQDPRVQQRGVQMFKQYKHTLVFDLSLTKNYQPMKKIESYL